MKIKILFFSLIGLLFLFCPVLKSQDNLKQKLSGLKDKIVEVKVDKTTFQQSFDILDDVNGKVNYTITEIDEKGKSAKESYEFYISDIDKNTLLRKTSGKKLFVYISVNNNQKFIKHLKEEKLDGYVNNLQILTLNPDAAQEVINLFKSAIPLVKTSEKNWSSSADALNWLKSNIGQVADGPVAIDQVLSFGQRKDYLVIFDVKKSDPKGASIEEKYEFNILDLNRSKIGVNISGKQLSVGLETSGSNKFIKYYKNNELQSYTDELSILARDIDQARNIIAALGAAINKSKSKMPEFTSSQKAFDFIKNNTSEITIESKALKQSIDFTAGQGVKTSLSSIETDSKGKSIENKYDFYLADIDAGTFNFKVNGKKIMLLCNTRNKSKLIKYTKDNAIQTFQNEIEILEPDIETTREVIDAFKYSSKSSEWRPLTWNTMNEAFTLLKTDITGEPVGTDLYKLSFDGSAKESFQCKYVQSKTDAKGATVEQSFEFYPYLLDANSIKIESGGKYLNIRIAIKDRKSYVKTFKDGKQQGYENDFNIIAFNAKQAREIAEAIKYISANGKPKDKVWSDKKTAMNYVKENIGDLKIEGKEIKQKAELLNDGSCKASYTKNTTDDKGKTTEEIFEFSLSDMNKDKVDFKINGKIVSISMVCKNGEKLVKPSKNGVQQSYTSEIEISADDIEIARNVANALKASITLCEK